MAKAPLYLRIKERIRADLVEPRPEDVVARLPAERELQARYGVSRPTISKALGALATEGLLHRAPGSGSFVLPRLPGQGNGASNGAPRRIGYVAPIPGHELTQRSLRGIEQAARRQEYRVIFGNAGASVADERAAVEELVAAGARGLVISPLTRTVAELADDYLRGAELPVAVVLIDTVLPEHPHAKVLFDNCRAAHEMTCWLFRRGHRRIGILSCDERWRHPTLAPRLEGHLAALREIGLPADPRLVRRYHPGYATEQTLPPILDEWLALPKPPTAIIATEDTCAMEVIEQLLARGVRVPEEVLVAGWDHRDSARRFRPHFPTSNPDFVRMGEIACDLLVRAVETGESEPLVYMLEVPLLMQRGHHAPAPVTQVAAG